MKTLDLIKKLKSYNRAYFTTADLEKITGSSRASLKVELSRLVEREVLQRLKRGVYALSDADVRIEVIANQLYYPSYLSFESALSHYGILSQVPYTQTFATTKQSKRQVLGDTAIEYRQIKEDLFFGFCLEDGIYIAEPEKALLDMLYMVSRGKATVTIAELDLREIDTKKIAEYTKKFPSYMSDEIEDATQFFGTGAITLETKERV